MVEPFGVAAGRAAARGARRWKIDDLAGFLAAAERGERRIEPGRIDALDGDDPDVADLQRVDDRVGLGPVRLEAGEVEHHRPVGEEGEGLAGDRVEIGEPSGDRRHRLQHEGQEGAAGEANSRTGGEGEGHGR